MRCRILILSLILLATKSFSQEISTITGNFEDYHFDRFVKEIEAQSRYHFYYDSLETDSLTITAHPVRMSISDLLNQVFLNTPYHFAITTDGAIFITKNFQIQPSLPQSYFEPGKKADTGARFTVAADKDLLVKEKLKISLDNKLFEIGDKSNKGIAGRATMAGYVRDESSGEPISGANIGLDATATSVNTDQFGYYSLTLPRGRHTIDFSYVGMKQSKRQVILYGDGKLDVELKQAVGTLKTVIVSAVKTSNIRSAQMGVSKLNIQTIKQVPAIFGETDIVRVILTLPGVTSVGEASNGFNVRGGAADQNLILFNDATIYNPSHLFGFFSAFDPDVVKGIELYKSAIPPKYGGRLSSVLDVSIKDGNSKNWAGSGGIGPVTSKFTVEGPIDKKTSVIIGGRTTYSNWLLRAVPNSAYTNSSANFYDATVHLTHNFDQKNSLYLMGYISSDQFNFNKDTNYDYKNANANLKFKHIFNNKSYGVLTAGLDHYEYGVSSSQVPVNAYRLGFNINQTYLRTDFTYTPNTKNVISYGLNAIYYKLHPGFFEPDGDKSLVTPNHVAGEQGLETSLYVGDQFTATPEFTIDAGVRYSMFNYLGPHDVYNYVPGLPRQESTLVDTTFYPAGKVIKTYSAPEIRISARYELTATSSVKASFNTTQQFIHLLTNTTNISPTDIWKLSDPNIKPQQGQQVSLGFYKNFNSNTIETSVEVYYKKIEHYLDYKSGAQLVLNHHIETDVFNTKGKAYGVELLIKKNSGKLNGWISYTYSRTFLKSDDPLAGELINKGEYYPASFDKPNNLNVIANYRFSHRYSVGMNVVYSTGRPITLPIAVFNVGGSPTLYYSDRNQYRIPDYFRVDLSFTLEGNHKVNQKFHNSWSAGVYNLTSRQNAYSVYFVQENGQVKGYQLSIFGSLIPFLTYNFRF